MINEDFISGLRLYIKSNFKAEEDTLQSKCKEILYRFYMASPKFLGYVMIRNYFLK